MKSQRWDSSPLLRVTRAALGPSSCAGVRVAGGSRTHTCPVHSRAPLPLWVPPQSPWQESNLHKPPPSQGGVPPPHPRDRLSVRLTQAEKGSQRQLVHGDEGGYHVRHDLDAELRPARLGLAVDADGVAARHPPARP